MSAVELPSLPTPHVLYRFYNGRGEVLYIGVTKTPLGRFRAHQKDKSWWSQVSTIGIQNFPTRGELLAAERQAIIAERPQYNVVHNGQPREDVSAPAACGRSYSLPEVAAATLPTEWKEPVRWLQRKLRRGEIPGYKVGHTWLMTEADVEAMVARYHNTGARAESGPRPLSFTSRRRSAS